MRTDLVAKWYHASALVTFFTDFDTWAASTHAPRAALRQEYEDLLMGTNANIHVPLWASVCINENGTLMDETTLELIQTYHRCGYSPVAMDHNPPDYIGQQLRFAAYLFACALHAENAGHNPLPFEKEFYRLLSDFIIPTVSAISIAIKEYNFTVVEHKQLKEWHCITVK